MLELSHHLRVTVVALVLTTCVLLVALSPELPLPASLHSLVLLGHLAALALGLGAVLPSTGTACCGCCDASSSPSC